MKTGPEKSLRMRAGYGAADFSCNMIWGVITTYLMYFYTDVIGLAAASVSLVFLLARVIDGAVDLLIGFAIDRTNTRWGKSRPYILFGAVPLGIFAALAFAVPGMGTDGLVVYAFVTYLGLSIFYSVVNIPLASLLPSLTGDARERTVLATWRIVFGSLGATVASILMMPLVRSLGGESLREGFLQAMIVFAVISTLILLYSFTTLRERVVTTQATPSLKKVFGSLRHNRPWQIFFANVFFMWGAYFLYQGALIYYFTYNVGRADLVPLFAGISTFVPLLGTLAAPYLSRRHLKRSIFTLGSAINLAGLLLTLIADLAVLPLLIASVISAVGQGLRLGIYYSMQADPVDYGQWKTGVNAAGTLSSFITFAGKLTMAGAGALSAVLLNAGGYVANQVQTPAALLAIEASFLYIPIILVVCSMVLMQYYRLDGIYPSIRAELDQREQASATLVAS